MNARYFCNIYFSDLDQYMYVANGIFTLNDRFDPMASELYLIKGIEQKEFRMIPYDPVGSLANSFNASHYDPRFDGSLRFKMYLRTNIINEIVNNADFSNVQFRGAFLASAVYQSIGQYAMSINYTGINMTVSIINNEYLLIGPSTWAD